MTYAGLIAMAMSGRGRMTTDQIYSRVWHTARREKFPLSFHWRATTRNTLQRHSRQSPKFVEPNLFIQREHGVWECRR
jgi:hypothetical protein